MTIPDSELSDITADIIWCLPTAQLEADLEDPTVPAWIKELIKQRLAERAAFKPN